MTSPAVRSLLWSRARQIPQPCSCGTVKTLRAAWSRAGFTFLKLNIKAKPSRERWWWHGDNGKSPQPPFSKGGLLKKKSGTNGVPPFEKGRLGGSATRQALSASSVE